MPQRVSVLYSFFLPNTRLIAVLAWWSYGRDGGRHYLLFLFCLLRCVSLDVGGKTSSVILSLPHWQRMSNGHGPGHVPSSLSRLKCCLQLGTGGSHYLWGWDWEDYTSRPAWAQKFARSHLNGQKLDMVAHTCHPSDGGDGGCTPRVLVFAGLSKKLMRHKECTLR
jgi:hypothetical protein